jgi:hypothetical protein
VVTASVAAGQLLGESICGVSDAAEWEAWSTGGVVHWRRGPWRRGPLEAWAPGGVVPRRRDHPKARSPAAVLTRGRGHNLKTKPGRIWTMGLGGDMVVRLTGIRGGSCNPSYWEVDI